MKSIKTIEVVSAHAEGEVGDVIVKGVDPPLVTQYGSRVGG